MMLIAYRIIGLIISRLVYYYNRSRWSKPAKPGKIIWINPDDITYSIEYSSIVKQKRSNLYGIILNGDWDKDIQTVDYHHSGLFDAFHSHFKEGKSFRHTSYFKKKLESENTNIDRMKKYHSYYDALYHNIKIEGFRISKSFLDEIDDFKVSIGSDGQLLFMTGKHRLAIARLIDEDFKIPVKVSHRHTEWQKYRDRLYKDLVQGRITSEDIREINHPDLMDLIES